jgi:hypothetical protein
MRDVAPRAPCRPHNHTPRHARTLIHTSDRRSDQGSVSTMCLRGMTRRLAIGRCHAARSHAPVPARRGHHWLATPPTTPLPFAHTVASVDNEGRAKPPLRAALPINPHPPSSCARPHLVTVRHRPPLPPTGENRSPLVPVIHRQLRAPP